MPSTALSWPATESSAAQPPPPAAVQSKQSSQQSSQQSSHPPQMPPGVGHQHQLRPHGPVPGMFRPPGQHGHPVRHPHPHLHGSQPGTSAGHAQTRGYLTSGAQNRLLSQSAQTHRSRSQHPKTNNQPTRTTTTTKTSSSRPAHTKTTSSQGASQPRGQSSRPPKNTGAGSGAKVTRSHSHQSPPGNMSVQAAGAASVTRTQSAHRQTPPSRVHRSSSMVIPPGTSTSTTTASNKTITTGTSSTSISITSPVSSTTPSNSASTGRLTASTSSSTGRLASSTTASTGRLTSDSRTSVASSSRVPPLSSSTSNVHPNARRPAPTMDRSSQTHPVEQPTLSSSNIQLDLVASRPVTLAQPSATRDGAVLAARYQARPRGRRGDQQLPDILNSHVAPPYNSRSRRSEGRTRGSRAPPPHGQTVLGHDDIECCSCGVCIRCVTMVTTFRWVLVILALLGVCCVVAGIILGTLHMTLNLKYLTLSLMFIGK